MDDLLKLVGFGVIAGTVIVSSIVGYRVSQDGVLLYAVVFGVLIIMAIGMTGLSFVLYRHAVEARRYHVDSMLTQARVMRTLDGVNTAPRVTGGGTDLFSALLASAQPGEIVDGQAHYPDNGGHDDD